MGCCCCKIKGPAEPAYTRRAPIQPPTDDSNDVQINIPKFVESHVVDQLVLEMLSVTASRTDNDQESPVALVKLNVIADKEDGWIQVVASIVNCIPLENPYGPTAISILVDSSPLPAKDTVIKLTELYRLSERRASIPDVDVKIERNMCIAIGCIAEKLIGPNSVAVMTKNTLDYLYTFLKKQQDPRIVLYALIAMQNFAHTTENKITINKMIQEDDENPFLELEKHTYSNDFVWRQVGFCAVWALDNLFVVEGRKLSYEVTDNSQLNALLNAHDASEYLQIASDGLEARCDSYSFESVRCTFQVDGGCWYYEVLIVTAGVMQIGWATKNSYFQNDEGYGIGDDTFSISYDGCRRQVWYCAKPLSVTQMRAWVPGDILGCLIDVRRKEVVFSLNGQRISSCRQIFEATRTGFFAAASFMAYQQCRFNFGADAFKFPPLDRRYNTFNDYGDISEQQRTILPRRIYLQQRRCSSIKEDACTLCCDEPAECVLEPCGHGGFCSICTSQLKDCPLCRADIKNVRRGSS
ncbi:RING finger and SPRY domain-containing protein 1-like [Aricia agestis]|uniref:RING finger and SPRY domain-containing protein 1-like n=1 Tax=Aricia agestis TaxID=91739 RepID=UPI001C2016E8|nr:RING finger and SPRY domain-containing protein 1-like [Aricia agestis]